MSNSRANGDIKMKIKQSDIHRICVAQDAELLVNMAYAEVGEDDYEVLGVFSGQGAGGGLFHQNVDGDISVSDDPGEFDTAVDMEVASIIFRDLERYRADFEIHDESGDLVGISEAGLDFLSGFDADDGYVEAYSEEASEDFIYDLQDEWNLNFYKD